MAKEQDNRCPICLDSWQNAAYVTPCLHKYCYVCIRRWAEDKPQCPLSGHGMYCHSKPQQPLLGME
uniref:RING-type E3 ubiquitin transferase n=1 Tax=Buteo japonicus TaxID=224669 RepID=A0A8C0AQZ2_9AVES